MVRMLKRVGRPAVFFLLLVGGFLFWGAGKVIGVSANLRFSHDTHYKENIACEVCHVIQKKPDVSLGLPDGWMPLKRDSLGSRDQTRGMPDSMFASEAFGRPPEKVCLACHMKAKNTKDCGLCHLGKPGPTERTRQRIRFGAKFPHDKHQKSDCLDCHQHIGDWDSLDGPAQQDTTMAGCLTCHNGAKAKKTCTLCHAKTPRPADHVRNYERKHGLAYRADPQACRMCHEDSSCVACHSRRPRDHTLAWVSRRHGITASSNPDRCAACHQDRDVCRRCHENW